MHYLRHSTALLVLFSSLWVVFAQSGPAAVNRHLLIVLDGLRPDYVTPALMPRLHALGQRGVLFEQHHSVFPTVTRVNASSISTGAYPATHGLMGNSVFFPAVNPSQFLDTSNRANLRRDRRVRERTPAHGADDGRSAAGGRPSAARRVLGVDRLRVSSQPHRRRRRDPAPGLRPSREPCSRR